MDIFDTAEQIVDKGLYTRCKNEDKNIQRNIPMVIYVKRNMTLDIRIK